MTAECGTHNLLAASVWHGEWKIKVRAKTLKLSSKGKRLEGHRKPQSRW